LAPIESIYGTSYWSSTVTLPHFRDIGAFVHQKPLFSYPFPVPIPAKISGYSPWSRYMMMGSVESEHPKLTNHKIIFEEFQPMWSCYPTSRTDRQTTCRGNTVLHVASCSKKYALRTMHPNCLCTL